MNRFDRSLTTFTSLAILAALAAGCGSKKMSSEHFQSATSAIGEAKSAQKRGQTSQQRTQQGSSGARLGMLQENAGFEGFGFSGAEPSTSRDSQNSQNATDSQDPMEQVFSRADSSCTMNFEGSEQRVFVMGGSSCPMELRIEVLEQSATAAKMRIQFSLRDSEAANRINVRSFEYEISMTNLDSNPQMEATMKIQTRTMGEVKLVARGSIDRSGSAARREETLEITAQGETSIVTLQSDGKILVDGEPATQEQLQALQTLQAS